MTRTTPQPGTGQSPQTTTTSYDTFGRDWKVSYADGASLTNEFTVRNEKKKVYGSRQYPVEYTFDAQGRISTMKTWQNLAGNSGTATTTWNYDQYRGWLSNKRYNDNTGPDYTYTTGGRLATRVWARGITTTYTADNAGGSWKVTYSDGTTAGITNTYDRLGRLSTIANNGITTTLSYNGANFMLSESYSGGILNGLSVTNDYDSYLRRASVRLATYGGTINAYTYDTASRLATVGDGTNTANYTYLANSMLVSQILYKQNSSTRMTTTKTYDLLNRLELISSQPSATNTAPFYFGYVYNDANQTVRRTEADGEYWNYGYDALGQVTSGKKYWPDGVAVEGEHREYIFDDIGNRKSMKEGGNYTGQSLRSANYTNNVLNQITGRGVPGAADVIGTSTATNAVTVNGNSTYRHGSFFRNELTISNSSTNPVWTGVTISADVTMIGNILTPPAGQSFWYDADGNLTNDLTFRYVWDAENRLIEIQPLTNAPAASKKWLTFQYDFKGRRIAKTSADWTNSAWATRISNRFTYDDWNLLGELNATNNNLIRGYVWGLDQSGSIHRAGGVGGLVAENDNDIGSLIPAFDGNGNAVGLTKTSDGSVSAIYEYDPFGIAIRVSGSMPTANPIRFSTKYSDRETGLNYFGYRYYNPSTGKWLSRDPIQEEGGNNLYAFVQDDAINHWDLLGQKCCLYTFPAANGFKSHSILSCDNGAYVSVFPSGAPIGSPPDWHDPGGDDAYFKHRTPSVVCSDCLDESKVSAFIANSKADPNARYGAVDTNCSDFTLQAMLAGLPNQTKPPCKNDCWSRFFGVGNTLVDLFSGTGVGQINTPAKAEEIFKLLNENNCQRYKCIQVQFSEHTTIF